ncbi:MAG: 7,8-didemethyl-8-hydroxy-5-deazariboflavin synthase subunit CofG [Methanosarcinales archaeon]
MPKYITFSRNVFIPLTNICRNKCSYCGFRRNIESPDASLLNKKQVESILLRGAISKCTEALFTFGEKPEEVKGFRELLEKIGYSNIINYLVDLCKIALEYGLLPHSNAGILNYKELKKLKPFNASMGLMLETTGKVEAHKESIGKNPILRLKTIENAGKLKIPFTTGILVGIGETWKDRIDSLIAIRNLHNKYGHIQEVIIQNFVPKPNTIWSKAPVPSLEEMAKTVALARKILQSDIAIQVPPNLVSDPYTLILQGARDLGGVSPETIDYINPESKWPSIIELQKMTRGIPLRERLPIYPQYIKKKWYSSYISGLIEQYADKDGLAKRRASL